MLSFKARSLDLRGNNQRSRNRKVAPADSSALLEWCPFTDEPGGKLKFPEQQGVCLELHLLQDDHHFLPVWLVDGVVVATLDPAEA
ncbi:MAG TPA: hypothetical protein VHO25_08365 [Polyangiaceae bacterium]|nr:hypothetical protein [Polyangiaceae bacterium]